MTNLGLNLEKEKLEQDGTEWKFGAASPDCLYKVPRALRKQYLPDGELQNIGEDKQGCVTRFFTNKLETKLNFAYQTGLMKQENKLWGEETGYVQNGKWVLSDAFNEILSGTTRDGNSFKAVAESIRKDGVVPKKLLPQLESFDAHYDKSRITQELRDLGKEFLARFNLNYEQVYLSSLEEALEKDIVGIAIHAYPQEVNGEFPRTDGVLNHAVMAFDKPLTYIFDNYLDKDGDFIKKLAKDYKMYEYGYRIYISKENTNAELKKVRGILAALVDAMTRLLNLLMPKEKAPTPVSEEKPDLIKKWAEAVRDYEGYFPPSDKNPRGSRSWRNRNPGNVKYVGQKNATKEQDGPFAVFKTYEDGFNHLCLVLRNACEGKSAVYKPHMTILQWASLYAPTNDNNIPHLYAKYVADRLGKTITTKLSELI